MHLRVICVIGSIAAAGCVGSGDVPTQLSGQIVGIDDRPLGPGLVLLEKGPVHEGAYERGALIVDQGRWTAELSSGGTWGIHLFHDDYTYLPAEVTIDENQQVVLTSTNVAWGNWMDLTGQPTWPDQPADSTLVRMPFDDNFDDNPVIESISMEYVDAELMRVTVEVSDPDDDLSRMILAYDSATGGGHALNPPGPPDGLGNFPNGTYQTTVFLDERHRSGETLWHFIVSDNLCNNSPITRVAMPPR